ncbi:MAG: hypothetical protein JWO08_1474 [Verrucomicrobiaceae bacterium]|nr:hypothetical protein [Verrucomicrobiaceae bacterium]
MKAITLPVSELRPALAGLGKVISKRSTLAVLGCVRLRRLSSGLVDLTVTDLDRSAACIFSLGDPSEPMTLLVPFADLANIAKSCGNNDIITVEQAGDTAATLRFPVAGQTIEHHCESLPPEQFPLLPEIAGNSIALNDNLRQSLHEAMECASSDPTRLIINGACLDVSNPDAHYVVGTDGRHLFSANSFKLPLAHSILIPEHKFLAWKGFNSDGEWRLKTLPATKEEAPVFELSSDHWRYTSRSVDGIYPNWKQVLPNPCAYQTTICIKPEAVEETIRAVQQLPTTDDMHRLIGLQAVNNELWFMGRSKSDAAWTRIRIHEAGISGPGVTIFLNRNMLVKALRFGLSNIDIIDAISPLRFSLGGRQMIVMPLRAQEEPAAVSTPPPSVPVAEQTQSPPPAAQPQHPNPSMQTTTTSNTPPAQAGTPATATMTGTPETKPALETALAQIESLKSACRESIASLGKLGDTIRQALREQKAGDKDLQSVRSTLRSLQGMKL